MDENKIQKIHINIENGEIDEVKRLLEKLPTDNHDKHLVNSRNESAVFTALRHQRLECYNLLLAKGLRLTLDEDFQEIIKSFDEEKKIKLQHVHDKYAKNPNIKYLDILIKKSRINHDADESKTNIYRGLISQAYEELFEVEWIVPILKVVSQAGEFFIKFDFNRESIDFMVPWIKPYTLGITFPREGKIYVGAKSLGKDNRPLGALAHELCHYAMQLIYSNYGKPYLLDNDNGIETLDRALEECRSSKHFEEIIGNVFDKIEDQHAELIVRVPHLLAHYLERTKELEELKSKFKLLFDLYEQTTLVDLRREFPLMEAKNQVKEFNQDSECFTVLSKSEVALRIECLEDLPINQHEVSVINSNFPELTMQAIYQKFSNVSEFASRNILTTYRAMNDENRVKVKGLLESCAEPWLFIDCTEKTFEQIKDLHEFFKQANNPKVVFVCKSDGTNENKTHLWSDLSDETQEKMLRKDIEFQGKEIKLGEIISINSTTLNLIPLRKLFLERIIIGKNLETFKEFAIKRQFQSESGEVLNTDDIINQAGSLQIILLSNEPGMGKSTEWKLMAERIKSRHPEAWVVLMDLKQFVKAFEKDGKVKTAFERQEDIAKYFCDKILKIENFEVKVFEELFVKGRVVFLMDGFDEISPSFIEFNLKLIKAIQEKSTNQIWISTRKYLERELKESLNNGQGKIFTFKMLSFGEEDREMFLRSRLESKKTQEELKTTLSKVQDLFSTLERGYLSYELYNPLMLRMIAEVFEDEDEDENLFFSSGKFNIFELYKIFVTKAFRALTYERGPEAEREHLDHVTSSIDVMKCLQKLALRTIFNRVGVNELITSCFLNIRQIADKELARLDLVSLGPSNTMEFIHRTFAEYFVSDFLINQITKSTKIEENELLLVNKILEMMIDDHWTFDIILNFFHLALVRFYDSLIMTIKPEDILSKIKLRLKSISIFSKGKKFELPYINETSSESHLIFSNYINWHILCVFMVKKKSTAFKIILEMFLQNEIKLFLQTFSFVSLADFFSGEDFNEILLFFNKHKSEKNFYKLFQFDLTEPENCFDLLHSALWNRKHNMFRHIINSQPILDVVGDDRLYESMFFRDKNSESLIEHSIKNNQFIEVCESVRDEFGRNKLLELLKKSGNEENFGRLGYVHDLFDERRTGKISNWLKQNLNSNEIHDLMISKNPDMNQGNGVPIYNFFVVKHFKDYFKSDEEIKLFLLEEDKDKLTAFEHHLLDSHLYEFDFSQVIENYEHFCGKNEIKKLLSRKVIENGEQKNILQYATSKSFYISSINNIKTLWVFMEKLFDEETLKAFLVEKNHKGQTIVDVIRESADLIELKEFSYIEDVSISNIGNRE